MADKLLNISIRIADQPRMRLHVPPEDEEIVRRAEANMTFRFAQLYFSAAEASHKVERTLEGLEKTLDRLLLDIEDNPAT